MSEYRKNTAISQSGLTNFSLGPQYYKSKESPPDREDSDALTIGTIVDILLSDPNSFSSEIFLLDKNKPSGQLGEFCDVFISAKKAGVEAAAEYAYKEVGFKRDSLEKVLERYELDGKDYVEQRLAAVDKIAVTPSQYNTAIEVYNSLLNSKYTSPHLILDNPNIESIKQLEIYWKYTLPSKEIMECKSKLDDLWIDHENLTLSLKDFKTTGFHVTQFPKSFLRFRYDLQAAFYTDAVNYYKTIIRPELKNYTIKEFVFIVESTKYIGTPIIYKCSEADIHGGTYGGVGTDGKFYKGYKELLEDLKWHIDNDEWKYERKVIENNGVIEINAFTK